MSANRGRWWIPWFVVALLDRLGVWCWAGLVMWRLDRADWPARNTRCVTVLELEDGQRAVTCYCGFWDHARCHANLGSFDNPKGLVATRTEAGR